MQLLNNDYKSCESFYQRSSAPGSFDTPKFKVKVIHGIKVNSVSSVNILGLLCPLNTFQKVTRWLVKSHQTNSHLATIPVLAQMILLSYLCFSQMTWLYLDNAYRRFAKQLEHSKIVLWQMGVKTSKTKVMVYRNRSPLRNNEVWFYADNKLDVVDNFNYFGTV